MTETETTQLANRIAEIEDQEKRLVFGSFSNDDAFDLGSITAAIIKERDIKLAVDVVIGDHLVYRAKLKDSDRASDGWLAKKAAVTRLLGTSSLLVRYRHEEAGTAFTDEDLDHEHYAAYGGSFPIRVDGVLVGTITSSGAADHVDHEVVVEAIERYLAR